MARPKAERTAMAIAAVAEARALRAAGDEAAANDAVQHVVHLGVWALDVMDAIEAAALADGPSNPGLAG